MRRATTAALAIIMVCMPAVFVFSGCNKGAPPTDAAKGITTTLNIATVSNPDMLIMQRASKSFTEQTGIQVNFITLPENELRRSVTEDVVVGGGKYDIVTIGTYDTPFWAENGWIVSLEPFFQALSADELKRYDREDLLGSIRTALSAKGNQYALPFYGESSILFYRKDLLEAAGLKMPEEPTWDDVYSIAGKLHNPKEGVCGIVLRGIPGWGQNMVVFNTMVNAFGARWYDTEWNAQFNTPEMKNAVSFYKKIVTEYGEQEPQTFGYLECLQTMKEGKAAVWYDASVAAGALESSDSAVAGKIGYAYAPTAEKDKTGWLWSWALAIESSSQNKDAAFKFIQWATSKEYIELIGDTEGWENAPPGTRVSTYENPKYKAAAPFSEITVRSIQNANYEKPTIEPVPYIGIQYLSIPEFQELGEQVSQYVADFLEDKLTLEQFLRMCQEASENVAVNGGYYSR